MTNDLTSLTIHTDGGVTGNGMDGAYGAWAFVAENGHEQCGPLIETTNNRAELHAIIEALRYARGRGHTEVLIVSDSMLCINCASGRWKRKANRDLWVDYDEASDSLRVRFRWVRGHTGVADNERCDELCQIEMLRMETVGEVEQIIEPGYS